jgi:hypothetical protein
MYSEVFAAIRDATKEAADERKKKEEEAEKAEIQEVAPSAPDNSSPSSEVSCSFSMKKWRVLTGGRLGLAP